MAEMQQFVIAMNAATYALQHTSKSMATDAHTNVNLMKLTLLIVSVMKYVNVLLLCMSTEHV